MTHYFLKSGDGGWVEVTEDVFKHAERRAGFRPPLWNGVSTGGFSGNNWQGRVVHGEITPNLIQGYRFDEEFAELLSTFLPPEAPTHLWEFDHPYYASECNYYSNEPGSIYNSWAEFFVEFGDADKDFNLLIRWDWKKWNPEDHEPADEVPEHDTLQLTYVMQRKGIYAAHFVKVTEADEPQVKEFIAGYWAHMQKLWEGS